MKSYKALSVVTPAGDNIRAGKKLLEIRKWIPQDLPLTDLAIVQNRIRLSSSGVYEDPEGVVVALVDVISVKKWIIEDFEAAMAQYWENGWYAWELSNIRPVYNNMRAPAKLRIYEIEIPENESTPQASYFRANQSGSRI